MLFNEQKQQELEMNIIDIYRQCQMALENRQDPVISELKMIGNDLDKSVVHAYLLGLRDAWTKYNELIEKERNALKVSVEKIYPKNFTDKVLILAGKQDYSRLGLLLQKKSLSLQGYVQGMVVQQLGDIAKGFIEGQQLTSEGRSRLQCMAVTLVQQSIEQYVSIEKETLDITQQRNRLTQTIISHQTDIAKIIQETYGNYLKA